MDWNRFDLSNIVKVAGDYLGLLGWNDSTSVMGIAGLGNAAGILIMIALIASVIYFVKNFKVFSQTEQFIGTFFLCSFSVMLICYSEIGTYNESYWVPLLPFTYIFMMIVFNKVVLESKLYFNIKRATVVISLCAVIVCSISTMRYP
jgi:hypothetical protein